MYKIPPGGRGLQPAESLHVFEYPSVKNVFDIKGKPD